MEDPQPAKDHQSTGYNKDQLKKAYLIFYNLFQVAGFSYVMLSIVIRYIQFGSDSFAGTFQLLGPTMKFLHAMQGLEILHPVLGLTKGGPFVPFAQLIGRIFLCFVMFDCEPRMAIKPVVPYLFVIWSIIEVIRHAFYYTQLRKIDYPLLTFIRYTAWIPLYPMGISGEAYVMVSNIHNFQESQKFNVSMPNSWNVSYNMPTHLRIHSFILCVPGVVFLMGHMYRMMRRQRKEGKIKI